jgi:phenylalanyl-tRNA synthetase beta chain
MEKANCPVVDDRIPFRPANRPFKVRIREWCPELEFSGGEKMLVSWDWLKQYVTLDVSAEVLADRLTMTGLNLEECHDVDGDTCIDFEVTSNRPDCLGHLGVAREAAVVYNQPLNLPAAAPRSGSTLIGPATSVVNECPDLCSQYFARVIRGVKVGPSPEWLQRRLKTVGIASINNIVDITNYVLMECGQPLHAFDLDKLHGQRIVVRRARAGEKLQAIDHKEYVLATDMCVIADADHPVALAGVMGGSETEITTATKNVLIESALFAPLSIRNTSRRLKLHSDSSYRFERALDPLGPDWASRRCCELILELAGGELLEGSIFAGIRPPTEVPPVTLRFSQIKRILGIEIPRDEAVRILVALGLTLVGVPGEETATFVPPSNRRDLFREIDLIEEVARIHGYDALPSDVPVPLCLSHKSHRDRVVDRVRSTLTGAGFFEAITVSLVSEKEHGLFRPRGDVTPLAIDHSDFRETSLLRQTLIPSLLGSRRANERRGTFGAQLFEIASVHLSSDKSLPQSQSEPTMVSFVSGKSFAEVKGIVEELASRLNPSAVVLARPSSIPQFTPGRGAELLLNGQFWGWLGELDRTVTDQLDLRDPVTVAELDLSVLESVADLVPKFKPLPPYQGSSRDLNFILDDPVTWSELDAVVRGAAGPLLESLGFGGQYRGKQIPDGKKSYLVTLMYRSGERTLTSDEIEAAQQSVIAACQKQLGATLRA